MKLDPEGVEKAARAMDREAWGIHPDYPVSAGIYNMPSYKFRRDISINKSTAALTAYFDHLRSMKKMRNCHGYPGPSNGRWHSYEDDRPTSEHCFPAVLIKLED